ncbi:MAG TPA: hypothetical protein VFL64_08130 [Rhizobacter sp.]|nr:hypothetical protein [Rhizobacter sp.]
MRFAYSLAGLALVVSASSHAAPPREGTLGSGKAGGPVMSMSQLRACLAQQSRIAGQSDEMVKAQQQLTADRTELERNGMALKDELAALDRTNKELVEAYVAKAQAHDKSIDDFEARVPAFNAKVEALQAERAGYAKACEGRRYLEDDYKDIKAGK